MRRQDKMKWQQSKKQTKEKKKIRGKGTIKNKWHRTKEVKSRPQKKNTYIKSILHHRKREKKIQQEEDWFWVADKIREKEEGQNLVPGTLEMTSNKSRKPRLPEPLGEWGHVLLILFWKEWWRVGSWDRADIHPLIFPSRSPKWSYRTLSRPPSAYPHALWSAVLKCLHLHHFMFGS